MIHAWPWPTMLGERKGSGEMTTAKPVYEDPEVDVFAWALVVDESLGTALSCFRLVGFRTDTKRGRMSTGVTEFDIGARTVRTESGRLYRLHGKPDYENAARALAVWCGAHGVPLKSFSLAYPEEVALAVTPRAAGLVN